MRSSIVLGLIPLMVAVVHSQTKFLSSRAIDTSETSLAAALGLSIGPAKDEVKGPMSGSTIEKVQTKGKVTKYTQMKNGIPVYGTVLTVREDKKASMTEVQGFIVADDISFEFSPPVISDEKATEILRAAWGHTKSPYLNFRTDEPKLNILQTEDGADHLVYKTGYFVDQVDEIPLTAVNITGGNVSLPAYIKGLVDAHTGEIMRSWNDIQFAGRRQSVWGIVGNRNTAASYELISVEKAGHWDCRHRNLIERIEVFTYWSSREWMNGRTTDKFQCRYSGRWDTDMFLSTGAYSPRNEAYVNADRFLKMWYEIMGDEIEPFRSNTSVLRMNVHYGDKFENAFFDGIGFYFGDGNRNYYPMMTLDVLCHEIGHGVTSWKGGNMEYWGESGAMNEAYSDIIGETCDMHFNKKNDFLIGEEVMRPGNVWGRAWRDMCDPASIRAALDHYSQYNPSINVHYTSGIYNKAWCRLTKTTGWGYIKAFEVFTDANLMYWNPTSTMHCGACGVEAAAADRGYNKDDVTAAFKVVGVRCALCR